jgi:dTDP-4-amino-4,6-dideoxygalactose transaminase
MQSSHNKQKLSDLVTFGGSPSFDPPISTSNLVKPSIEVFFKYSKIFHESKRYTNDGALLKLLEIRLAEFHQVHHCITYANGFWALVAAIKCVALPGKSEVLMPSLTYRRLADVVAWAGLKPRFCEISPENLALDPKDVERNISSDTALILGVHPIVNTCDAPALCHVGQNHSIPVIFDSVESVYETINGKKVGTFGEAECFSMHASKLLNGFEGGYVTTNNPELAHQLAILRGFGFFGQYNIEMLGLNAKLSEIHAAMALASLDDLEDQIHRNLARYRTYQKLLTNIPGIRLQAFNEHEKTSFKTIVVELVDPWPLSRDMTIKLLNSEGALVRAYYSPPLHSKPMAYAFVPVTLPITDTLAKRFMLLPCGHMVTEQDIKKFVSLLRFISNEASLIKGQMT